MNQQFSNSIVINNLDWHLDWNEQDNYHSDSITFFAYSVIHPEKNGPMNICGSQLSQFFTFNGQSRIAYLQTKCDLITYSAFARILKNLFSAIPENFDIPDGMILGGYLTPRCIQVSDGVGTCVDILNGKSPESIAWRNHTKDYWLDYNVMSVKLMNYDDFAGRYKILNVTFNVRRPFLFYTLIVAGTVIIIAVIVLLILLYRKEIRKNYDVIHTAEKERLETLAQATQLKEKFLSNISHEIRTPLNAIVGFSNIIADSDNLKTEDLGVFKNAINSNSKLLLNLISDFVTLSKIESQEIKITYADVLIRQLVGDLYLSQSVIMRDAPFAFLLKQGPEDAVASSDYTIINEILTNFLSNAKKFTRTGRVTMGWLPLEKTKEIEIYVADTGIGMTQDQKKNIFNMFYKADSFSQGTGLGLNICRSLAKYISGRIEFESELGKGTTFSLIIKAKQ